ncbi:MULTISPECIES: glycosyltransferase family 4 protein [unclassified Nostoc]|uniref:glycosyltransferase family 4 protein n=1 Tax=unclassified Nostoc TaxID=2593658 RepID=UPI0026CB9B2D
MMKVLQISLSDHLSAGGGSIAMYRLYNSLKNQGVDGKILAAQKSLESNDSKLINTTSKLESLLRRVSSKFGLNDIHKISSYKLTKDPFYLWADIINFHVIHSGFFNYLAIPALTESKPAVFTLHDMWAFTGHCIYSYDCTRWKFGCGKCPYPKSYPSIQMDNTALEWKLKKWTYSNSNLTIVTPSRWLTNLAQQSILNCFPIHYIPYGIDTEAYKPLDTEKCRSVLGIPTNKKVLMFGAQSVSDRRKGSDLLLQSLSKLPASLKSEIVVLILGNNGDVIAKEAGIDSLYLGYVTNDRLKSMAYSAADLFIFPTRADNLPLVLQESMACGTPMISFNVGGIPDLVRPNITGYLAEPEKTDSFSEGIINLLEDNTLRSEMKKNCREIAIKEYALDIQARKYIDIYQSRISA